MCRDGSTTKAFPSDAFIRGTFIDGALSVFLIVGALGLLVGWWGFRKKDIAV